MVDDTSAMNLCNLLCTVSQIDRDEFSTEGVRQHVGLFSDYTDDCLQYIRETLEANPTFLPHLHF